MKHLKITACLVVHNEEKLIDRCLRSCNTIVDSILVVHDGVCTDRTVNICKNYGCTVFIRPHIGEAEPHRAWLYSQVKTPWILQLDADEFLSEKAKQVIIGLEDDVNTSCYDFIWPNWDGSKYTTHKWPAKKILFKKDSIHFIAFPHEEVTLLHGAVQKLSSLLEHKPLYNNFSADRFFHKWLPWSSIHARYYLTDYHQLETFPSDIKKPPHYTKMMMFAPLSAPLLFAYHFAAMLVVGAKNQGFFGYKLSLMMASYYTIVNLKVGYYRFMSLFGR